MRLRKHLGLDDLLSDTTAGDFTPHTRLPSHICTLNQSPWDVVDSSPSHICTLNQSPWDVVDSSPSPPQFDVDEGFPVNCSNIGDPIGSPQSVANKKMKIENERELQGVNPQEDDFMKVTGEDIFICKCSKIGDSIGATESVSLITTKRKRAASEHTLSIFQEIPYDLSSIAELNVANPSLMSSFDQRTVYGADILGIHKVWLSDIENQLKQSSIDQAQAMLRIETKKKGVQELAARLRESTDELRVAESRVTSVSYSFLSLVLGLAQKSRDPLEDYGKTC